MPAGSSRGNSSKTMLAVELDRSIAMVSVRTWLAIEHGLIQMLLQLAVVHGAGGPSEQLTWLFALKPPSCHPPPMLPGPLTLDAINRTSKVTLALAAVFLASTLKALLTAFTSKNGTCRWPTLTRTQREGAMSLAQLWQKRRYRRKLARSELVGLSVVADAN